jgi:hypothetical protein
MKEYAVGSVFKLYRMRYLEKKHRPSIARSITSLYQKYMDEISIVVMWYVSVFTNPTIDLASKAEWLRSLTSTRLTLITVGSKLDKGFGFFHVRKLSSYLTERRWFY